VQSLLLQWKSNECYTTWVCICILRHPACNAHAPNLSSVVFPLYNTLPHYLINGTIFEKKLLNTKCVFWFSLQLLYETFFILRRNEWDTIKNVYWSSCKVPLFLSDFNETWILSTEFRKILKYQMSWKSVEPEPSCYVQTDGRTDGQTDRRTDMTKQIVTFRNFANPSKNQY
jgi:hypothetical protein